MPNEHDSTRQIAISNRRFDGFVDPDKTGYLDPATRLLRLDNEPRRSNEVEKQEDASEGNERGAMRATRGAHGSLGP